MFKAGQAKLLISVVILGMCWLGVGRAQSVKPVPALNLRQITGVWYEVARLPNKREKSCQHDVTKLISLGDKARTLQIVDSCRTKAGYNNVSNAAAKQDKAGTGRLNGGYWPFTRKLWVIELAPDDSWAVVGSPNHKQLVILSRSAALPATELAALEAGAANQGFRTGKLTVTAQE